MGERIVFVSTEHINQEVVVGKAGVERMLNGVERLVHPPSVKFSNGRLVLDSEFDKEAIESLRQHRDYGVFIKELDEKKIQRKIEAQRITAEQVVCPYCHQIFSDISERNQHIPKCDVKNRPKIIRGDQALQDQRASQAAQEKASEPEPNGVESPTGRAAAVEG